jgi:hypothetical protein
LRSSSASCRYPRPPHEEAHVTFSAEGLARLKHGLEEAGLDARHFAWPPEIAATAITGPNLADNLWTELALWRSKSAL